MQKGYYGEEPFNFKLALLRLIFNLHWIVLITVAGTLVFGGGYCVKHFWMQTEKTYMSTSVFKVDYADENWAQNGTYINYMTWNTWVQSREFLENVERHLEEAGEAADLAGEVTLTAKVDSDLRVPAVMVTGRNREACLAVSKAVETTMTTDFPIANPEDVSAIRVIDSPKEAPEVLPDVRPVRAFVLSAILSGFFAVVIFLLREWGCDSIWIPSTLHRRYGLRVVDTCDSMSFQVGNLFYYKGMNRIAVCSAFENVDTAEVSEYMNEMDRRLGGNTTPENRFIPTPALSLCGEAPEMLRQADGILLVVQAGAHAGKPLEYALEYLEQQECKITCAILWGGNDKLTKLYYGLDGIR